MNLSRELAQDKGRVSTVYTNNEVDSVTDSVSGKEGNLLRMFSGMSGMELEAGEWPVDWGGRKAGAGALEAGDCYQKKIELVARPGYCWAKLGVGLSSKSRRQMELCCCLDLVVGGVARQMGRCWGWGKGSVSPRLHLLPVAKH